MSKPTEKGKDVDMSLSQAIRAGDIDTVRLRLAAGANPTDDSLDDAENGEFPEICKELIRAGAMDINRDFGSGGDLLINAVWELKTDFVEWLLKNGANANSGHLMADSTSALCAAAERGHMDLAQMLIDHGARVSGSAALPAAAGQGNIDMVRFLMEQGADMDEIGVHDFGDRRKIKDEGRALHKAAARGDMDLARLLVEKGARLEVKDPLDRTPLMRAREEGHEAMVGFLESKGVKDA